MVISVIPASPPPGGIQKYSNPPVTPPLRVRGGWEELRADWVLNSPRPSYIKRGILDRGDRGGLKGVLDPSPATGQAGLEPYHLFFELGLPLRLRYGGQGEVPLPKQQFGQRGFGRRVVGGAFEV